MGRISIVKLNDAEFFLMIIDSIIESAIALGYQTTIGCFKNASICFENQQISD